MARAAKLGKKRIGKHIYWYTKSGGRPVYFGNVKDVGRKAAEEEFHAHCQAVLTRAVATEAPAVISVGRLVEDYLAWSRGQFSAANYANKKSSLNRWVNHTIGERCQGTGKAIGDLAARSVSAAHLHDFIAARRRQAATAGRGAQKVAPKNPKVAKPVRLVGANALAGDMQHVKACFNWAAGNFRRVFRRREWLPPPRHAFAQEVRRC